ncbi:lasso peptide biosynthesis protein [Sinosporangium siamense]|uniref:Microcin J25-processing protein McjB C-terminal domain-containing protein n=1 Tax=Sinosporangium siamense TaxID=1367973 RepID=A0A919RDY5_9ACTN|nr:lasso peptide biosynthesis protein [Sinosporangium siamense]GII91853.1 hypothetical protein Ssi02_20840 [Sinosporangium siamense]
MFRQWAERKRLRRVLRDFALTGDPAGAPRSRGTPPPPDATPFTELLPALVQYLRVGRAFRRRGLGAALAALPSPRVRPGRAEQTPATVFHARDAAWRLTGLGRTFGGRHLCLHESLAICAALRWLGYPVEVVVGYPVIEPANGGEELHAWPVLGDAPLSGRTTSAAGSYIELLRYPAAT